MAEEFANFMQETRKAPLEEKLNSFGDIVEKMMFMILKIPDLVEQSLAAINQKISTIETRINTINNDLNEIKRGGSLSTPIVASPKTPASAPPPPSGPPGGPPPPPGGPPEGPGAPRPASPVSLRGAIMSELKQLFNKRKTPQ